MTNAAQQFPSIYEKWFQRYIDAGYQPRPITPGTKECHSTGWQTDVATVQAKHPGVSYGLGLRLGTKLPDGTYLAALDADHNDFVRLARALVRNPCGRFGSKGIALFVRVAKPTRRFDLKLTGGSKAGELLGTGSLCIIPPTMHPDTNQPYEWTDGKSLLEFGWENLPLVNLNLVKAAFASEHLATIIGGVGTHDAMLRFVGQLVHLSGDDDYIEQVCFAALPEDYKGDSDDELRKMIKDARSKLESGQWTSQSSSPEDALERMNAEYCVVMDGGKTRVLRFDPQVQMRSDGRVVHKRLVPTFLTFADFYNYHLDEQIEVGDEGKLISIGHWWARHPQHRKYAGLIFRPDAAEIIDGRLNLWKGWGVEPAPGDWSLMQQHIKDVVAAGDDEAATYILNWLAWAVQYPAERAQVALVLQGGRGTGKGTLGNAMCQIFGQHATHISSVVHLAGRFNAHLRDACLLFADEAYWPGDKSGEGTVKRLITEPTLFIEGKGKDAVTVENMLHVLMASNEDWTVPAGEHERRYAVFKVSEDKRQDERWFAPLYKQLDSGGYAAMLYDLLKRDLGDWHPRRIPNNEALRQQQLRSLKPLDAWVLKFFEDGILPEGLDVDRPDRALSRTKPDFDGRNPRNGLYDLAREHPALRHVDEQVLAAHLKQWGCTAWRSNQARGWEFPPLTECRARWEEKYPGWRWQHPDLTEWQQGDNTSHIPGQ